MRPRAVVGNELLGLWGAKSVHSSSIKYPTIRPSILNGQSGLDVSQASALRERLRSFNYMISTYIHATMADVLVSKV